MEADCRVYIKQGEELKREQQIGFMAILWQGILNLMGHSDKPTVLTGEAMDQQLCIELATSTDNPVLLGWVQAFQSVLNVFFGDHRTGAEVAMSKGKNLARVVHSHLLAATDPFYRGISLFDMARKTKKILYRIRAHKVARTIKGWVRKGNPNVKHLDVFLDAEASALAGNTEKTRKFYEKSVVVAARGGFVQHAALANERYGEYLLHEMKLQEDAAYRFDEAIKFYSEWGSCKAEMLREKYADLPRFATTRQ